MIGGVLGAALGAQAGCYSSMAQLSLGQVAGWGPGRAGGAMHFSAAVSERSGAGLGFGSRIIVTDDVATVAYDLQLVAIGPRMGQVRVFGRAGLGFNLGWVDGDFGGGGLLSAEAGTIFSKRACGPSLHAGLWYLGRVGEPPNEPFLALHFGWACAHHRADPRR